MTEKAEVKKADNVLVVKVNEDRLPFRIEFTRESAGELAVELVIDPGLEAAFVQRQSEISGLKFETTEQALRHLVTGLLKAGLSVD